MLYQEGKKLKVENLDKPVQISVPVSAAADLASSCAGQPSDLQLANSMGSGQPGCLDAMECRYYDHNISAWSTEGCTTTQFNRSGASAIGCSCNHLSDFAAVKVPTSLLCACIHMHMCSEMHSTQSKAQRGRFVKYVYISPPGAHVAAKEARYRADPCDAQQRQPRRGPDVGPTLVPGLNPNFALG